MFDLRSIKVLVLGALAMLLAFTTPSFSSATFTASSTSNITVSSAAGFPGPTVSIVGLSAQVSGHVMLEAEASDAGGSAVVSVTIQTRPRNGGSFTPLCTVTSAPYECSWDTTLVAGGDYEVQALATDGAGLTGTSEIVTTTVSNQGRLVLTHPDSPVRGPVSLQATMTSFFVHELTISVAPTGTSNWTPLCGKEARQITCTWSTTSQTVPDGTYDLRARATLWGFLIEEDLIKGVVVDNTAPQVSMENPGVVTGRHLFKASVSDAGSGVSSVAIQYQRSNNSWVTMCTVTAQPWSCEYEARNIGWGFYSFRAVATDVAGNSRTSATVTAFVIGLGVNAADATIVHRAPSAEAANPDATDEAVPDLDEPLVSETDPAESDTQDETVVEPLPEEPPALPGPDEETALGDEDETVPGDEDDETAPGDDEVVEEAELRGVGIDVTDGGNGVGSLDEGDAFTFTYSGEIDLSTVLTGWAGEATAVSVRLRDGQLLGGGAQDDTIDIRSGDLPVELGRVNVGFDVIDIDQQIFLPATMTAATLTVDGALLSTVVVTLGPVIDEDEVLLPAATAAALTWTPSAAVTTVTGRACMAEPVTQSAGGTF